MNGIRNTMMMAYIPRIAKVDNIGGFGVGVTGIAAYPIRKPKAMLMAVIDNRT